MGHSQICSNSKRDVSRVFEVGSNLCVFVSVELGLRQRWTTGRSSRTSHSASSGENAIPSSTTTILPHAGRTDTRSCMHVFPRCMSWFRYLQCLREQKTQKEKTRNKNRCAMLDPKQKSPCSYPIFFSEQGTMHGLNPVVLVQIHNILRLNENVHTIPAENCEMIVTKTCQPQSN